MKFEHLLRGMFLTMALCSVSPAVLAAPDEIQVYTDEINDPGQFGVELHTNYALDGARQPAFNGEMLSHHRLQATPEFSYGLTKTLEAGLYLPVAFSQDGNAYGNGLRLRMKFIAPREDEERFFWGLNTELGYSSRRVSESHLGMELRPILGYRTENWLASFNPILNMDLSGGFSHKPQFEPGLKVMRKAGEGMHAGFEYYGEFGPANHLLPSNERAHSLYAVMDIEKKDLDLNIGIGRGFDNADDAWVVKAIIAFPFK